MAKPTPSDFFTKEVSQAYDERNKKLAPIAENLHFLIRLLLNKLPPRSHVLCVGVGTGGEIISLGQAFPNWTFVGVDPSASMLEICEERLKKSSLSERCKLVHGYIQDLAAGQHFDAALSILVAHFIKRDERLPYFENVSSRLKAGGTLINAEISFDLDSEQFPFMLKNWEEVQKLMGATPETLVNLPKQLREVLSVLPPDETEAILSKSGIEDPVLFFRAFLIAGWYGRKRDR